MRDYAPDETTTPAALNRWFWPTTLSARNPACWATPFLADTGYRGREHPPKPARPGPRKPTAKRLRYCRVRRPFDYGDLPF